MSEHYRIPWDPKNLHKRYEFYDQSRDSIFYLSWHDLWKASFPKTKPDLETFMLNNTGVSLNAQDIDVPGFSDAEQKLMVMFGFWDSMQRTDINVPTFLRDMEFVVETTLAISALP